MTKRTILIGLMVLLLAVVFATPGYCDGSLRKLGRGLCNIGTFPFELPLQVSRVNKNDGPMAGATYGVLKGIGMMGTRLFVGIYEVLTFPIAEPKNYEPILKDPEFFFEEYNW